MTNPERMFGLLLVTITPTFDPRWYVRITINEGLVYTWTCEDLYRTGPFTAVSRRGEVLKNEAFSPQIDAYTMLR